LIASRRRTGKLNSNARCCSPKSPFDPANIISLVVRMAEADRVLDNLETDIHAPVMTYRRWVRIEMPTKFKVMGSCAVADPVLLCDERAVAQFTASTYLRGSRFAHLDSSKAQ
jgi:hypothetical protein